MLTLDTFGPAFGQPDASPFCVKSVCLLTVAGVQWEPGVGVDSRKAPYEKLPMLHDGEQLIPDSDNIRFHLEKVCDVDFDASLNPIERSQSRALLRMAEEQTYFCLVYHRWVVDENWQVCSARYRAS